MRVTRLDHQGPADVDVLDIRDRSVAFGGVRDFVDGGITFARCEHFIESEL